MNFDRDAVSKRFEDNPYKDKMGRWITQGLFIEHAADTSQALYTLKGYDLPDHPSIKKIYLELEDPTEYTIATEYFGGWDHWLRLCANKTIRAHIDEWRSELEVKLRSQAIRATIADAKSDSKSAAQSRRFLADKGWKEKRKAGAPSRAERAAIERDIEQQVLDYADDWERVMGKPN
jgi:hypothetical protein